MTNFKEIYKDLPYNEIKKLNAPWIKDVEQIIKTKIEESEKQLKEEAEYDGQPEFNDDKFLYERFKDNCENNMYFGNWQVLKYFYRKLRIKIYNLMLGKITFTDEDMEMFNYFNDMKVSDDNKCKPSTIKIKSSVEITEEEFYIRQQEFLIYYEFETASDRRYNDVATVGYFTYFQGAFGAINDMIRNVKMLSKYGMCGKPLNLFKNENILTSYILDRYSNRKILNKTIKELKDCTNLNYKDPYSIENNAINLFTSYIKKDKKYNKLCSQLEKQTIKLYKEFKKTDTYNLLNDIEKSKLDGIIKKED